MDAVAAAAVDAAAATSIAVDTSPFNSPPRYAADDWKTLSCVTAPKMLTMVGHARQPRIAADTSGFVLIKFQVVSVAPEERAPHVEDAARTLHAMGTGSVQNIALQQQPQQPPLHQPSELHNNAPPLHPQYVRQNMPILAQPRPRPAGRNQRKLKPAAFDHPPNSPDGASSSGSDPADNHPCKFPGCAKTFERRYNLRVHMRRHTGETPYPCKQPGCSLMFKWRSSLAHHMKTRHKVNVVSAQIQKTAKNPPSPGDITDIRASGNGIPVRAMRYTLVESPNGSSSGSGSASSKVKDERMPLSARNYGIYPRSAPSAQVQSQHGIVGGGDGGGGMTHPRPEMDGMGNGMGNMHHGLPRRQNLTLPIPPVQDGKAYQQQQDVNLGHH